MECKHFSHHHPLVFYHLPQPSQHHCSGCKSPATGDVYACWQCSYFLHGQCYRATRSLHHPSHPLHPLTLVPFPTYPSSSFFCNSCSLAGDAFSYTCAACEFDIHLHCALNPNPHQSPSPLPHNPLYPPPNPNPNPHHNPLYPPPNPNPHQSPSHVPHDPLYPPPNPIQPYPPHNPPPNPIQPYPPHNPPQPTSYPPTTQHCPPPPTGYPTPQNYVPPPTPTTDSTVVNAAATTSPTPAETSNPQAKPPPPSMIKHFSHPHVLKLMEIEKSKAKVCSACECAVTGAAYCCTEPYCAFNLHKPCFDSPREVKHKSHLQHPLTLLAAPPYSDGFTCNACLKDGKAFAYHCRECGYDLHIDCIQWPDTVRRPDHKHNLTLFYSSPGAAASDEAAAFVCDVCRNPVHEMAWLYLCQECDFGTHLECVVTAIQQPQGGGGGDAAAESEEEELLIKLAMLQLLLGAQAQRSSS